MNTTRNTTQCRDSGLKLERKLFRDSFRDKVSRKGIYDDSNQNRAGLRAYEDSPSRYTNSSVDFGLCSAHVIKKEACYDIQWVSQY